MSRFTDATYTKTEDWKRKRPVFCLTSPLVYEIDYLGSGWKVYAEEGFCTDLVSIPSWIDKLIRKSKWGTKVLDSMARSSIVHDKLRTDTRRSKLLGDWVFFEAMGVDNVKMLPRCIAFTLVLFNFSRN